MKKKTEKDQINGEKQNQQKKQVKLETQIVEMFFHFLILSIGFQ